MPNELAYYDDENGNRSYFADDTARGQIAELSNVVTVNAVSGQSASSKVQYVMLGKMVVMNGFLSGGSTYMSSGTKVFEGLPKPAQFLELFAVQSAGDGYKRFALNTNGEVYCYASLSTTHDIQFYVCYLTA